MCSCMNGRPKPTILGNSKGFFYWFFYNFRWPLVHRDPHLGNHFQCPHGNVHLHTVSVSATGGGKLEKDLENRYSSGPFCCWARRKWNIQGLPSINMSSHWCTGAPMPPPTPSHHTDVTHRSRSVAAQSGNSKPCRTQHRGHRTVETGRVGGPVACADSWCPASASCLDIPPIPLVYASLY